MENLDAIYIINLKFQSENLKNYFSKLPISKEKIIIYPAVNYLNDKKLNNISPLEDNITNSTYISENIGVRGCFLSHYRVYKHAIQQEYKLVLILEDDLLYHHLLKNDLIP